MKTQLILLDTPIIVSDEEIKEGNWCIDKSNCIYKQETDKVFDVEIKTNNRIKIVKVC